MGERPKIKLSLIEKKECGVCHYSPKIGDTFDFDTERGAMCPMALHVAFTYIDILRYGGSIPSEEGLIEQFGEDYIHYRKEVNSIVPNIERLAESIIFSNKFFCIRYMGRAVHGL